MYKLESLGIIPYANWLDSLGVWLTMRSYRKAIAQGISFGDFLIVPRGYTAVAVHRQPELGSGDPLMQHETIGWKLMKDPR